MVGNESSRLPLGGPGSPGPQGLMEGSCFVSFYFGSYLRCLGHLTRATTTPLPCISVPFSVLGRCASDAGRGQGASPVDPSPSPGLPFRAVTLPQLYLPAPLTKPPPDHTLPFSSLPSPFCSHLAEVWTQDPSRWWVLGSVCDPQEDLAPRTRSGRRRRGSPLCGRRAQHAESPGCWGCTCSLCPQVSPGSAAGGTSGSKRTGTRTLSQH